MTDIEQFVKIQTFMREEENAFDCSNESQATYKVINNYFKLVEDISRWKKIALAQMDTNKQLEAKFDDGWHEKEKFEEIRAKRKQEEEKK